jgi:hypothetical protein
MSAAQAIRAALACGVTLAWRDGGVKVAGKEQAVRSVLPQLKRHKSEIEAMLRPSTGAALTTRLMTEAMLYCDRQGDTPAARQAMREQVLQTPDHQQADLLEHFIYQRRGAVVTTPSTSPPPPRRPELPPEPSPDPQAWRELAKEYHLHHWGCTQCQAAGRGTQYGRRCAVGLSLWVNYQDTEKTK